MTEIEINLMYESKQMSVFNDYVKHRYTNHKYWKVIPMKSMFKLKVILNDDSVMYAKIDPDNLIMLTNDITQADTFKFIIMNNKIYICSSDNNSVFMCCKENEFAKMDTTTTDTIEIIFFDIEEYQEEIKKCQKEIEVYQKEIEVYQEKIKEYQEKIKEHQEKIKEYPEKIKEYLEKIKEYLEKIKVI